MVTTVDMMIAAATANVSRERYWRGVCIEGNRRVEVVPVEQRTTIRKQHFRATFSVMVDGAWKRVSRVQFEAL